jgi:hypothetical protein
VSAATGAGVPDVLRALVKAIDEGRHQQPTGAPAEAWHP